MQLYYSAFLLEYKHHFGVSSNIRTHTQSVFIKLVFKQFVGYGEACLPAYLGETLQLTTQFFKKAKPILQNYNLANCNLNLALIQTILMQVDSLDANCNAAKAAIDIALHDLIATITNQPVYKLLGITKPPPCQTSFTIGIDDVKLLPIKINQAAEFKILKIKAGTKNDKALINLIRTYTNKPLYVDVNQGWTDKYFVLEMLHWLKQQNVILVEQPMPIAMIDEMAWVNAQSPLPIIADESVKRLADIEKIKHAYSGINIKLMKSTGLHEAYKMITLAKQLNLKIFLGCMAESACATSAMAQLMYFADYVDLDAPNLLTNNPFTGVTYLNGNISINTQNGIGVTYTGPNF